jgi:hypothetical protein
MSDYVNVTGRATTDRGRRYLDQMIDHLGALTRRQHHPDQRPSTGRLHQKHPHGSHRDVLGDSGMPAVLAINRSERDAATVAFAIGSCEMRVEPDAVMLTIDAATEADLRQLMALVGERLETIGRRDGLVLCWTQVAGGHESHRQP